MTRPSTTVMLDAIAEALPKLGTVPARTTTLASGTGYRPAPGSRVLLDPTQLEADALRDDIHARMGTWVRACHEEGWCADEDWPADSTTAILMWLERHAIVLDSSDMARDWQHDVRRLWRRCEAMIGQPVKPKLRLPCRRCSNALEGRNADGQAAEEATDWRWAACPMCGQTETLTDDLRRLGQVDILTIAEWASIHRLETGTLKLRIQRAGLEPDGRDERGRRLYHRDTIAKLLDTAA